LGCSSLEDARGLEEDRSIEVVFGVVGVEIAGMVIERIKRKCLYSIEP